ncbi:MAG: hypothetical protein GFH27_549287n16 [Chloroflexi bacterium AL-W]|nr:hypothetical protein [Chloroflexi bacterium AL-W]
MRIKDQKPSLRMRVGRVILWLGVGSLLFVGLSLVSSYAEWFYGWTGLSSREVRDDSGNLLTYYPAKTLWDWFELLLIPVVLTGGGIWFTRAENHLAREIERKRVRENHKIEEERLKEVRDIERERAQDVIVKDYLDQMTGLLLSHGLRTSLAGDEVRSVARARTLTALRGVDGGRKATIVQFLYEAQLIGGVYGSEETVDAVIQMQGADLSGADLNGAKLTRADLAEAKLAGANLNGSDLNEAKLTRADLNGAKLAGADLAEAKLNGAWLAVANLTGVKLVGANLAGASLAGAKLGVANLNGAKLTGAKLVGANLAVAKLIEADLAGADLTGADLAWAKLAWVKLEKAKLERAKLERADLTGASLVGVSLAWAKLTGTDLTRTDLAWSRGLTLDQLLRAESLHGADLPKYIDPADLGDLWSPPKDTNMPEPQP